MISITGVRHNWPNPPDFHLIRPNGHPDFTFVHFTTSVDLYLNGEKINTPEHACIIYKPGTAQDFHCPSGMLHDWFHFTNIPPNLLEELNLPTDLLIFPKQWSFITNLTEDIENEFGTHLGSAVPFSGQSTRSALKEYFDAKKLLTEKITNITK